MDDRKNKEVKMPRKLDRGECGELADPVSGHCLRSGYRRDGRGRCQTQSAGMEARLTDRAVVGGDLLVVLS